MATHSSIPWTEELGGLQSTGRKSSPGQRGSRNAKIRLTSSWPVKSECMTRWWKIWILGSRRPASLCMWSTWTSWTPARRLHWEHSSSATCASASSSWGTWRTESASCCRHSRKRAAGAFCTPSASTEPSLTSGPLPTWSHFPEFPFGSTFSFLILVFTFRYSAGGR